MEKIVFSSNDKVTPQEFIALSRSVGWGLKRKYDMRAVRMALATTTQFTARNSKGELVGCGRVLSDGLFFSTVPDLFVHPEHQKKGIGRRIMNMLKKQYAHTGLFFGSQPGNEQFFEKLGFKKGLQSYQIKRATR